MEKFKNDSKVQSEISQTIEKYSEKSYSAQSKIEQKASVQNKSLNKQ